MSFSRPNPKDKEETGAGAGAGAGAGVSSPNASCITDGSELIVDFSQRQRGQRQRLRQIMSISRQERQASSPPSNHTDTQHTNNTSTNSKDEGWSSTPMKTYKQVRFSDDIRIRSFPYPSKEELFQRWDSKKDKVLFKQELARDVQCIRHLLSSTPMEALNKEVLYWCLGLEALVSVQVTRLVRDMKVGHSRSIVQMQHHLSDEQLASYARRRSLQSRERAQELAAGNWQILS